MVYLAVFYGPPTDVVCVPLQLQTLSYASNENGVRSNH